MLTTGCVTERTLPEWQGEQREEVAERPPAKCVWPDIIAMNIDGEAGGFLDTAALNQLTVCRKIANATHDVATASADSVDELIRVLNKTNELGIKQTGLAEFQLNALERDRRDANLEAWSYKGLLAIVLVAVAL